MASVEYLTQIFDRCTSFFESTQFGLMNAVVMNGSRPGDRQHFRELLQYVRGLERAGRNDCPFPVTRVRNTRYPPSRKLFKELYPILLINLLLDTPTRGHYLKLRTISSAVQCNGITTIVEDENHNYGILFMDHHYESDSADGLLPKQSVLLIKEPFYTTTYEGRRCVRLDHPADVTLLLDGDPKIPQGWRKTLHPASWYNSAGVDALKNWEYQKALRMFVWRISTCLLPVLKLDRFNTALHLKNSHSQMLSFKHNRTKACLHLCCYDQVVEDVEYLILSEYFKENALLRGIEAAYKLQLYDNCHTYLVVLKEYFPDCPRHDEWACRICKRLKEMLRGNYDFRQIWKNPPSAESPLVDYASYLGPMELRETKTRGRGLFAAKSVKAGELLLCEKAFSAIMPDQSPKSSCFVVSHKETTLTTNLTAFALRTDIVQKLVRNPSLRSAFNKLYDGGYGNSLPEGPTQYVDA